jgi:Protein of unknown function (DUF3489)
MSTLSDTQAVILSAASQRDDGAVLPLPETLKIKGGAVDKVLGSLKAKGLIDHQGTPRGDDPPPLRITRAGLEAIGVETEDEETEDEETQPAKPAQADVDTAAAGAEAGPAGDTPAPAAAAGVEAAAGKRGAKAKAAKTGKAGPADKPTARAGTKQAQMIELLKPPEGATVEQIAAATGWQHHTIRGAISGALKKKLGLMVEATRTREVGPNKTGAKGSTTVYRIIGSSLVAGGARSTTMHRMLKQPGYRLHAPDSPEARALLAEQGLGPADLEQALVRLEQTEGTALRTIAGINEDGVFGTSRAGWHPDLPDACREPFIPLLWLKVHELLGRVPEGSTARFAKDGTLPGEAQGDANAYRMAS